MADGVPAGVRLAAHVDPLRGGGGITMADEVNWRRFYWMSHDELGWHRRGCESYTEVLLVKKARQGNDL